MIDIRKILIGLGLYPVTTTAIDTKGELEVLDSSGKLNYHNGTSASPVVTEAHSSTLTNKSIDADTNTITNIENADIKAGAAIDFSKLATLSSANILVGSAGNVATSTAVTGDISINNTGVTAYAGTVPINKGGTGQTTANAGFNALSPMTTAGDIIVGGVSGAGTRLAAGSNGQVLTLAAGTPSWAAAGSVSPLTTKGDLYGFSTVDARLPVGTNGQKVVADSAQTLGVKWQSDTRTINAQTGTTYTFALSDGSGNGDQPIVTASNASAQTYTVPPNSSVAFPVGTQIDITQLGAGLVTLAAGSGVTLDSASGGLAMLGQYSAATLIKTATDVWKVYGTGLTSSSSLTLSDWTSYTPTIGADFGTCTEVEFKYRRVGDSVEVRGFFVTGTLVNSGPAGIGLPSGLSIDTAKISAATLGGEGIRVGAYAHNVNATGYNGNVVAFTGSSSTAVYMTNQTSATYALRSPSWFAVGYSNAETSVNFTVPVSGWTSTGSSSLAAPRSMIRLSAGNGHGSTNTHIRRFTTTISSTGSDITYADSATLGATFTIATAGVYSISYSDSRTAASGNFGISLNSAQLTTSILSLTNADILALTDTSAAGTGYVVSWTGVLAVNDVIRCHDDGTMNDTGARSRFTITKVSN